MRQPKYKQTATAKHWAKAMLIFSLIAGLSGCGFHLRGSSQLPANMQPVYLASEAPYSDLSKAIFKELKISGVKVTRNATFANSQLVVNNHRKERRSQSLDGLARTAEYAYYQSADVTLRGKDSKNTLPTQTVRVRRVIVNDPNSPVAERAEERIVTDEMTEELAAQIVRQLDYWARLISRKR